VPTVIVTHEVEDVDHWLKSTRRTDVFGPLGISLRTFTDPTSPARVGLVGDIPDMDAFHAFMQTEAASEAMKHDGVRPETMIMYVEATR
jgi:hypothetical protein